jgi:hypothetical protein
MIKLKRIAQNSEEKIKEIRKLINAYYDDDLIDILDLIEDVIDDGVYH